MSERPPALIKALDWYKKLQAENRAASNAVVWEYTEGVAEDKAFLMRRSMYDDGRHRVFLNPIWKDTVESEIATVLPHG